MIDSTFRRTQRTIGSTKSRMTAIQDYDFAIAPTYPPSTSIMVSAGKAWLNLSNWFSRGYNVEKPSATINFASDVIGSYVGGTSITYLNLVFSSPHYYKAVSIGYDAEWIFNEQYTSGKYYDFKWGYYGGEIEYPTAAEAEAEIDALLNGARLSTWYGPYYSVSTSISQMPLWSFILRGDGGAGIMPIDRVNRGGSYMYRDMRPNKNWITT